MEEHKISIIHYIRQSDIWRHIEAFSDVIISPLMDTSDDELVEVTFHTSHHTGQGSARHSSSNNNCAMYDTSIINDTWSVSPELLLDSLNRVIDVVLCPPSDESIKPFTIYCTI